MKLFYPTRSAARSAKGKTGVVRDCKDNPSPNNSRWAVDFKPSK